MAFTRQQLYLSQAATALGIHYELNYEVCLPNAETIVAPTFISKVGGVMGNLVFVKMPDADTAKQLITIGYGITAYREPSESDRFGFLPPAFLYSRRNASLPSLPQLFVIDSVLPSVVKLTKLTPRNETFW